MGITLPSVGQPVIHPLPTSHPELHTLPTSHPELHAPPPAEFKEMFEDIQKGGMGALMKYMNDPRVLSKLGSRLGDVQVNITYK
jgi:hypothetical protein